MVYFSVYLLNISVVPRTGQFDQWLHAGVNNTHGSFVSMNVWLGEEIIDLRDVSLLVGKTNQFFQPKR